MNLFSDLPHPKYDSQFYEGVPSKRLAAWFVDAFAILVISLLTTGVLGVLTLGLGFVFFPAILFIVSFGYRWVTITGASATPGMYLMGIELRNQNGDRLDPLSAAIHTGIFMFLMATIVGWIATVFSILGTRYNQGIPDLLLGTTAINRPVD
ncbi:MAG: RDD family protein [Pseudomonadota bacterium]